MALFNLFETMPTLKSAIGPAQPGPTPIDMTMTHNHCSHCYDSGSLTSISQLRACSFKSMAWLRALISLSLLRRSGTLRAGVHFLYSPPVYMLLAVAALSMPANAALRVVAYLWTTSHMVVWQTQLWRYA